MTAIDRLDAWLRISPSIVLPAEVLEYLDDVKTEDAELREAARDLYYNLRNRETVMELMGLPPSSVQAAETAAFARQLRELGIEVGE